MSSPLLDEIMSIRLYCETDRLFYYRCNSNLFYEKYDDVEHYGREFSITFAHKKIT